MWLLVLLLILLGLELRLLVLRLLRLLVLRLLGLGLSGGGLSGNVDDRRPGRLVANITIAVDNIGIRGATCWGVKDLLGGCGCRL